MWFETLRFFLDYLSLLWPFSRHVLYTLLLYGRISTYTTPFRVIFCCASYFCIVLSTWTIFCIYLYISTQSCPTYLHTHHQFITNDSSYKNHTYIRHHSTTNVISSCSLQYILDITLLLFSLSLWIPPPNYISKIQHLSNLFNWQLTTISLIITHSNLSTSICHN